MMEIKPIKCNVIWLPNAGIALLFSKKDCDSLFSNALNSNVILDIDGVVTNSVIEDYDTMKAISVANHLRWLNIANSPSPAICNVFLHEGKIELIGKCSLVCNIDMDLPERVYVCSYMT